MVPAVSGLRYSAIMASHSHPGRGIRMHGKTYWLNVRKGGKRHWINLETDDFAEAVKNAAAARKSPLLSAGQGITKEIASFITYKQRMNEYTAHTARTKRNKLLLFAKELGATRGVGTIVARDVQRWHDSLLKRDISPTTITGYMMTLQAFFRWAVEVEKLCRQSPMKEVKFVVSTGRARQDFCEYELRDALVENAPTEELRLILLCGFHAGLRFNEIIQARPFWFDLRRKAINLRQTATMKFKDREERTVPMTLQFHNYLRKHGLAEPFIVAPEATQGKWLYRYDFRASYMKYMRSTGFCCGEFYLMGGAACCLICRKEIRSNAWVTPHIMRHTFASLLVSAGESIYKVAVWMGDEVGTVQKHYGHLAPDHGGIEKAFSQRHLASSSSSSAGAASGHSL